MGHLLLTNERAFFLSLQNRVRGGEDADKLVCLLAPQISQGKKMKSISHLIAAGVGVIAL